MRIFLAWAEAIIALISFISAGVAFQKDDIATGAGIILSATIIGLGSLCLFGFIH